MLLFIRMLTSQNTRTVQSKNPQNWITDSTGDNIKKNGDQLEMAFPMFSAGLFALCLALRLAFEPFPT